MGGNTIANDKSKEITFTEMEHTSYVIVKKQDVFQTIEQHLTD